VAQRSHSKREVAKRLRVALALKGDHELEGAVAICVGI
jgi:hypothetical protein